MKLVREIDFSLRSILEPQPNGVRADVTSFDDVFHVYSRGFVCQPPILGEVFPMHVPPFENEGQCTRRKLALDVAVADPNCDFLAAVPSVKMSGLMLPMIHGDHDAKKTTDL